MKPLFAFAIFFATQTHAIPNYVETQLTVKSEVAPFGDCPLGATQLVPLTPPKAVVLFVHGSGAQDRDENFPGGYAPFKDIAEYLSTLGVATFRYDKRTFLKNCIQLLQPNYLDFTPEVFIRDVEAVATHISQSPELGHLPLFLLGHSQGVNFVLDIAARKAVPLAGTILMAGLGAHAIDATLIRQYEFLIQTNKYPEQTPTLKKNLAEAKQFFPSVRQGTAAPADTYLGAYTRFWADWIGITDEAATMAAASPVPSLLLQGDADWNVSQEDFQALKEATQGVAGSRARWFPGLYHSFTTAQSTRVAPEVLSAIRQWIGAIAP